MSRPRSTKRTSILSKTSRTAAKCGPFRSEAKIGHMCRSTMPPIRTENARKAICRNHQTREPTERDEIFFQQMLFTVEQHWHFPSAGANTPRAHIPLRARHHQTVPKTLAPIERFPQYWPPGTEQMPNQASTSCHEATGAPPLCLVRCQQLRRAVAANQYRQPRMSKLPRDATLSKRRNAMQKQKNTSKTPTAKALFDHHRFTYWRSAAACD